MSIDGLVLVDSPHEDFLDAGEQARHAESPLGMEIDLALSRDELHGMWATADAPLDDLSVVVITHGQPEGKADLVALSTNSKLVAATEGGHSVLSDQPDLVFAALRDMVESVRRSSDR